MDTPLDSGRWSKEYPPLLFLLLIDRAGKLFGEVTELLCIIHIVVINNNDMSLYQFYPGDYGYRTYKFCNGLLHLYYLHPISVLFMSAQTHTQILQAIN